MKRDPNDVNRRLGPCIFLILGSVGSVINTIKFVQVYMDPWYSGYCLWLCDFRLPLGAEFNTTAPLYRGFFEKNSITEQTAVRMGHNVPEKGPK
jgi:hypothetical protein